VADDLETLLERIQKDGISRADAEAEKIIAAAKTKAEALLAEAQRKAADLVAQAEKTAALAVERGNLTLQQTARDVMLALQNALQRTLQALAEQQLDALVTPAVIQTIIADIVRAYFNQPENAQPVEIRVSPDNERQLADYCLREFRDAVRQGLTIRGDAGIGGGFKVVVVNAHVEHDFSTAALAEAVCRLLRPRLAEIVRAAAAQPSARAT
jgi:V/A-type H+-transporting ATPase subunit E